MRKHKHSESGEEYAKEPHRKKYEEWDDELKPLVTRDCECPVWQRVRHSVILPSNARSSMACHLVTSKRASRSPCAIAENVVLSRKRSLQANGGLGIWWGNVLFSCMPRGEITKFAASPWS